MQLASVGFQKPIAKPSVLDALRNRELKFNENLNLHDQPEAIIYMALCLEHCKEFNFKISEDTFNQCLEVSHGSWVRPFMKNWNNYSHGVLSVLKYFGIIPSYDDSNTRSISYYGTYYSSAMFLLPENEFDLLGLDDDELVKLNRAANLTITTRLSVRRMTAWYFNDVLNLAKKLGNLGLNYNDIRALQIIIPEYRNSIQFMVDYMRNAGLENVSDIDSDIVDFLDIKLDNHLMWFIK